MTSQIYKKCVAKTLVYLFIIALLAGNGPVPAGAGENELFFTLLHTNDEHSALLPAPLADYRPGTQNPALGGFARLAQAVAQMRHSAEQAGVPVLLVSAGDFLGGSPYSWLALHDSAPELSLMIKLGYDVVAIGNHEYDYGTDTLASYLQAAGYPDAASETAILASNTIVPPEHQLSQRGLQDTFIKELDNGLTVGFFSLIGKSALQDAPLTDPLTFSDQHETAREMVAQLQKAGSDVIVAVTHSGVNEDRDLAQAVPGIHIIVGGHCHTALEKPLREGDTLIVQAGERLNYLGVLQLSYNRATGKVSVQNEMSGQTYLLALDDKIASEPLMSAQVAAYTEELEKLIYSLTGGRFSAIDQPVVYADFSLPDSPKDQSNPFSNFVTDAMRLGAQQVLGERVDFAFQANGVIRGSLVPGSTDDSLGKVTLFDLVSLVGLGVGPDGEPGNPLVSVYFTGEEIRRILEVSALLPQVLGDSYLLQISGLRMTYDPSRAILLWVPIKNIPLPSTRAVLTAERYIGESIQGEEQYSPLRRDDKELYHVVTDYYLATFLPMVGEMLPSLTLVMKDSDGNPTELDDLIIYRDGSEYKVWQAVVEYAANQPRDGDGITPRTLSYYGNPPARITIVRTIPLLLWPLLTLGLVLSAAVFFIYRRRKSRRAQTMKT